MFVVQRVELVDDWIVDLNQIVDVLVDGNVELMKEQLEKST